MAKINTYPQANTLTGGDKLIGTQVNDDDNTKNFTLDQLGTYFGTTYQVPTLSQVLAEGNTATSDMSLTGDLSLEGSLIQLGSQTITGGVGMSGNLSVGGTSLFTGAATFANTINASSITASSNITGLNITATGDLSASGSLDIGESAIISGGITTAGAFSGVDATLSGTLGVTGVTTLGVVNGGAGSFSTLSSSGTTTVGGNLLLNAGLRASGTLGISGQILSTTGSVVSWINKPTPYLKPILISSSTNTQNPANTTSPLKVTFGGAVSTSDIILYSNGTISFLKTGSYIIDTNFLIGNDGANDCLIHIVSWTADTQISDTSSYLVVKSHKYQVNTTEVIVVDSAPFNIEYRVYRDNAYGNSGGLQPFSASSSSLYATPSASIKIYKLEA